ncbi:hypothetical protein ACFLTH_04520 [Bacteroidota bacterium]
MKAIICLLAISILMIGCGGPESDFEKAKEQSSIDSYVNFIKTHPESELVSDAKYEIGAMLGKINIKTIDKDTKEPAHATLLLTAADDNEELDSLIMNDFKTKIDTLNVGNYSILNLTSGYYSLYLTTGGYFDMVQVRDSIKINGPDTIEIGIFEVTKD